MTVTNKNYVHKTDYSFNLRIIVNILFIITGMKIYTISFLQFILHGYKGWHHIIIVCNMAQPVSHRALIMEGLVKPQVSPCGMCDVKSGNGTGFSLSTEDLPLSVISPMPHIHSFMYHGCYIILATDIII